ncbi:pseudouridine synthase [Wenzhouxiangellaceae bacterium CH-27]|uniref:Pseudouridine synthase n=1 Tax=Elongatibacter sediminis TaxID=3119006 RepID=A0AAW9RKG7_9GAMM
MLFNKPWGVLSQFTDPEGRPTLADFVDVANVYPAGRLDRDSEGLLLLTDDGTLQHRIAHPGTGLHKTYLAQVEGIPSPGQLSRLQRGIKLKDGMARAVSARLLARKPGWLWRRDPPVRVRKRIADRWIEITLDEGRNRQVRRMTAAVGLPTLRLVRVAIGPWSLDELAPGTWGKGDPNAA